MQSIRWLCLFVIIIGCAVNQQGCNMIRGWGQVGEPPVMNIIHKDTNTEFLEEQGKIVVQWMQQNDYHLSINFQYTPPAYILRLGNTDLCATQSNDPAAWTRIGIEDLTLEARLNYFIIRIKDVGEAAFTLDGEGTPLPYDLTDKETNK